MCFRVLGRIIFFFGGKKGDNQLRTIKLHGLDLLLLHLLLLVLNHSSVITVFKFIETIRSRQFF